MDYLIQLTIGDWSDDGHGKSVPIIYKSNKDVPEVRKAYRIGTEIIGVDLFAVCSEYEDSTITKEQKEKFRCLDDVDDNHGVYIGIEEMCNMWLEIIRSGDPDLLIEKLTGIHSFNGYWANDEYFNNSIGYGCF